MSLQLFDTRPGPGLSRAGLARRHKRSPPAADAASMAITLLANVIAKAAAAMGSGVVGDE